MTFLNQLSLSPQQALGPAAFAAVVIVTTALLGRRPRTAFVPALLRRRLGRSNWIVRWFVIGGLTVVSLFVLGVDLQGLWSTLVAVLSLVAIGFVAMWSILSHMLASILIVIFRPFGLGDRVEIVSDDPVVGEVTGLNPVYTTLRADDGGTLQVPNNLFFQKALKRHVSATLPAPLPLGQGTM